MIEHVNGTDRCGKPEQVDYLSNEREKNKEDLVFEDTEPNKIKTGGLNRRRI